MNECLVISKCRTPPKLRPYTINLNKYQNANLKCKNEAIFLRRAQDNAILICSGHKL